eukprot:1138596-Pelagomonas_calceolata.AAC.1
MPLSNLSCPIVAKKLFHTAQQFRLSASPSRIAIPLSRYMGEQHCLSQLDTLLLSLRDGCLLNIAR